uniref:Putative secreted protein n=1 Tax=Anopheles darlingi TaxID=43151 RepID=A0A2M4D554_ANODA
MTQSTARAPATAISTVCSVSLTSLSGSSGVGTFWSERLRVRSTVFSSVTNVRLEDRCCIVLASTAWLLRMKWVRTSVSLLLPAEGISCSCRSVAID